MLVKDVMSTKLFFLHENLKISIDDILRLEKIRNIPVVDSDYKLVGLVTYRELIKALAKKVDKVTVKDFMIEGDDVRAVNPETPLKGVIDIMIVNRFGCLPVVDENRKLVGIVTEIDLLKTLYELSSLPDEFYKPGTS